MVRFAYVVLSHRDPELTARLARTLREASPDSDIVIRHDARSCDPPRLAAVPRVHVRPSRALVRWGDWTLVEAMLVELRWVLEALPDATHVTFISGQDYPSGPLDSWERSHEGSDGYVSGEPLWFHPRWLARRGFDGSDDMIRYSYRWFSVPFLGSQPCKPSARGIERVFNQVRPVAYYRCLPRGRGTVVGVRRVRVPWSDEFRCYKGWQWLSLSRAAGIRVLGAADTGLARLYRHSLIPDESFIHTVVLNDTRLSVVRRPISYADWQGQVEHPRNLDSGDLPAIIASGLPFARKVDLDTSAELLAALDVRIAG